MLLQLTVVVGVPARAVEEAEVVRDLDQRSSDSIRRRPSRQQLAELATVALTEATRFILELEDLHEFGAGQAEALGDGLVIVRHRRRLGGASRPIGAASTGSRRLAGRRDVVGPRRIRPGRPWCRSGRRIRLRTEETRASAHVGVTDQDIRGAPLPRQPPALVSYDGANRRIK